MEERRERHLDRQLQQQFKMMKKMMMIARMGDHMPKRKRDNCDGDRQDGEE